MGTNTLAPFGFRPVYNKLASSPTQQASGAGRIKPGYATVIGFGDVVCTQKSTDANQGYLLLYPGPGATTRNIFGIFGGCQPFYDQSAQQVLQPMWWSTYNNPNADVSTFVYDDEFQVFQVQMSGGPWTESMRGQNIDLLTGTNGAPNSTGISTACVDATTINTTNTLPFRILDVAPTLPGGPQDPTYTNPVILVRINTSEDLSTTGV